MPLPCTRSAGGGIRYPFFVPTYADLYRMRFGAEPAIAFEDLAPFLAHRSVRRFADAEVPEDLVAALIGCAQSASTSSNLQMWSVVSIQDPERRARIAELCANQDQVRNAPWFLAWLADANRVGALAEGYGESAESLESAEMYTLSVVDAALAAERFAAAAESVGLGLCYIGALRDHPEEVAELLGLPDRVFGVFGMCLGYPAADVSAEVKPRLRTDSVWFRESYGDADTAEYDARMRAFYEAQQMKGDVTWSMRSARRLGWKYLGTRAGQLAVLQKIGFLRR